MNFFINLDHHLRPVDRWRREGGREWRILWKIGEEHGYDKKHAGYGASLTAAVRLACENIRFSSLLAAWDVSRDMSPAAKSEEKRMFSQATVGYLR